MSVKIPSRYKKLRASVPVDCVSIGYASIQLAPVSGLDAVQQGYGVVPECGETDWREEWIVIGHEGRCGDPIFIDTKAADYPVYTAEHGMGEWAPQLIACTFQSFVEILLKLQTLAHARSNPVELERNPISAREKKSFLEFVRSECPDIDFSFWEAMCEMQT